jgi:hypothetical protein
LPKYQWNLVLLDLAEAATGFSKEIQGGSAFAALLRDLATTDAFSDADAAMQAALAFAKRARKIVFPHDHDREKEIFSSFSKLAVKAVQKSWWRPASTPSAVDHASNPHEGGSGGTAEEEGVEPVAAVVESPEPEVQVTRPMDRFQSSIPPVGSAADSAVSHRQRLPTDDSDSASHEVQAAFDEVKEQLAGSAAEMLRPAAQRVSSDHTRGAHATSGKGGVPQTSVDRQFSKLKHSSLLLTVEKLRRLARRESFRSLLDDAALRRLDRCDALVTLLPRFKEDAMLTLSPSSMVCVNRKCSPLALAVAVAPTIEAKHLLGATGVILIGADSVHVLQNRAARDEARAKCRSEPLAQLPPRRTRVVAQRSSPGLHRRRARAKCRGRHGGLGSATWARLLNGQLVDVPEKRKDLLGAKVLKKLTVNTAKLINKLKMSGTNTTGGVYVLDAPRSKGLSLQQTVKKKLRDTSASVASNVVRSKLGDKWATGDVAFVDLGKVGNIYGVIHRAQLRREFVIDVTKHTKRKLYDSANMPSFEETATRPGWVLRNRRHAVDVGIARMFKKSDPLVVFLNSDYTRGFTPVLRQLLRLGTFVVLVDEFRTSKHCHGCARELDTTTERCDKAVCPTCARGEVAHKRFGKLKLDQARRAVRELGQKKEAPVVVEVRADAQKLYEQNTSQAKAKAGAKVTSKARGLTKECTIKLLCKLSGSVEGGKTRVLQGNNGGRLVHSIGTQISPPRAPNVLKDALSFQRVVALEQLSTANLRRRLWRALARAPCSDCQPHERRCESCRRKAALNKAKKCCLCLAEINDKALLVSEEKTSWRIKRCPTEGCASGGRVHRDDNGARNCAKIVLFMFSDPAAGPRARPYPLWECDLERQHCADGKPMPWDKSWFGGRDDDRHDSSDDGESAPREHDDESADTGVTRHTAAPRQQHVGDEASGGDDESSDGSTAATLALSRRARPTRGASVAAVRALAAARGRADDDDDDDDDESESESEQQQRKASGVKRPAPVRPAGSRRKLADNAEQHQQHHQPDNDDDQDDELDTSNPDGERRGAADDDNKAAPDGADAGRASTAAAARDPRTSAKHKRRRVAARAADGDREREESGTSDEVPQEDMQVDTTMDGLSCADGDDDNHNSSDELARNPATGRRAHVRLYAGRKAKLVLHT